VVQGANDLRGQAGEIEDIGIDGLSEVLRHVSRQLFLTLDDADIDHMAVSRHRQPARGQGLFGHVVALKETVEVGVPARASSVALNFTEGDTSGDVVLPKIETTQGVKGDVKSIKLRAERLTA
jgi:hypothetical protein